MKRFLSFCLAVVLAMSALPLGVWAGSDTPENIHRAAFSDTVTVDGVPAESALKPYGTLSDGTPFGILWDSESIYIAADTQTLSVSVNGSAATPAESRYAQVLEMRFSLEELGIRLIDYSQTASLTLTSGDGQWEGTLHFSSLSRTGSPVWSTKGASVALWTAAGSATSVGSEAVTGGMRLYNRYVTPVDANDNAAGGRVYWLDTTQKPWAHREGTVVLEADLLISKMPQLPVKAHTYSHVFAAYGVNFALSDGDGQGITTAVTNTDDGLYFALYSEKGSLRSVPLGKQLGDRFHLTQELRPDGTLKVYADDVLIGTFPGALREQKYMKSVVGSGNISFNLWSDADQPLTSDGAFDSDVTVTNVSYGVTKGETALDSLGFGDIRGNNLTADAVRSDLNLMTSWSNGQLRDVPLSWSSSDENAIDPATGKVAPTENCVEVILTATVTGTDISKEIAVTVAPQTMDACFTDSTVTLDGVFSEQAWPAARAFSHVPSGAPTGSASAMWYREKAYFAVNHTGASTLKLELQGCQWTVDLTTGAVTGEGLTAKVGSGTVELAVDLAAAGIKLLDYNVAYRFQITLTGAGGTSALEPAALQLVFVSREQVAEDFSGSGENYKNYVVRDTNNGLTFQGQHAADPEVLYAAGISAVSIRKDVLWEMDLDVKTMPVSTGAVSNNWQADGLYLFLLDYDETLFPSDPASQGNYAAMGTVLYNTEDGLMLRVRQGATVTAGTLVPLGRKAGDGSFRLGILWRNEPYETSVKGYADIYLDGTLLKTVEWVNYNYKGSKDSVNLRYYEDEAAEITLSNMTVTVENFKSVAEEITVSSVLAGIDLSGVTQDLTLPESFDSPFLGKLPLSWKSSNEEILKSDGTVIRPAGKAGRYADLTLCIGDQALWTESVYILGADTSPNTAPAILGAGFTAEAPVMDGTTTDHGWNMNTAVQTEDGDILGRLGAQWDTSMLYLALEHGNNTPVIVLNGKTMDLSGAATAGGVMELSVSLAALGITQLDYGEDITASVTLADATWQGVIRLTSNDWFYTDSTPPKYAAPLMGSVKLGNDDPTANQGVTRQADGFRFYDLYDKNGSNPTMVRSYAIFYGAAEENKALLAPLADRTVATFVEFDFLAESMPLYTLNNLKDHNEYYASSGFCWLISGEQVDNLSDNISFSILNTEDGLILAARGTQTLTLQLNKRMGDRFRIGVRWECNGDVTVFVDGEAVAVLPSVQMRRGGVGNTALAMSLIRGFDPAESNNDNFDVYITNIALGKTYGDRLLDSLTFDSIRGENTDPYSVTEDLSLPETLSNPQLTEPVTILWSSSAPDVVSADGTVTPGQQGMLVTLTATLRDTSKEFLLYVPGTGTDLNVLIAENDKDTANGAGIPRDVYLYTLDRNNNSVIFDQKESKAFNSITLTDSDDSNRLNESNLAVWVSDDNITYTRIQNFKLLHTGTKLYLYGFEAVGRYVKVHCTIHTDYEADFTAPLASMIRVSWEEVFGSNGGTFAETTAAVTNTADHRVYDAVFAVDGEAQRVLLEGKLLYHYTQQGKTYVRIPEMDAGQTLQLTLLSGNPQALDTANREYVYEVVYGTREVIQRDAPRWIAAMPDGSLVGITTMQTDADETVMAYHFSHNGGLTWTDLMPIDCSIGYALYAGGVGVDPDTGRIITHCIGPKVTWNPNDAALSDCKTWLFYSDDYGKTWTRCPEMTMDGKPAYYYLSYTDPTKLRTADGADQPGVDFVLPLGVQSDKNDGSLVCRVAYSTDGGASWTMSASQISYTGQDQWHYEGGVSESTILQQNDGTLVLYGRCQFGDVDFFARSYSKDCGITWQEDAELSEIYTVNTQPLLHNFNGQHVMTWAGNTVLGGNSYKRFPLNVAVSTDDGITFSYIQDLFSRTPLQGMDRNNYSVTNQHVASAGDTMSLIWGEVLMRVDGFTDYLYRTKGAYDTFEHSTMKAEGWSGTLGDVGVSSTRASDGSRSMKLDGTAAVTRSIPYLQQGTVSFDLFVETAANMTIELEAAHGEIFGKASPVALEVVDSRIVGTDLTLQTGQWNSIRFDLALTEGKAMLTVNGETEELTVNSSVGDYICWIDLSTAKTVAYVDAVQAEDHDGNDIYRSALVMTMIGAIGEVTLEDEQAIAKARTAYEALTDAEKAEVTNYEKLLAAEEALKKLQNLPGFGINLVLNETIDMNLIPKGDVALEGNVISLTYADGSVAEYTIANVNGSPAVRHSFNADQMSESITIQIFDAQGRALTKKLTVSVRDYVGKLLSVTQNDTEKALMIRLLDYGALAQIYGARETGEEVQAADLANSIITSDLRTFMNGYDMGTPETYDPALTPTGSTFSANLTLNESVDLNVYVNPDKMLDNEKIVVKLGDQVLTEGQYKQGVTANGEITIRYSFNADAMNEELTVALADETSGEVRISLSMSVRKLAYVSMTNYSSDSVLCATFAALLDYGALAQQYAGTNTNDLANRYVTADQRKLLNDYPWPTN